MFPAVGQTFLAGLRGALADAGVEHEIVVEPGGTCAVRDQVVDKIQRLLLGRAPDVVTGVLGAGVTPHVHGFFRDARTPVIINGIGADPLMTGGVRNPFVFSNTFNLWQSMFALGFWASRHLGAKAAVATGLHEAGYGIVQAFWLGFCEAGGGTVLGTEVTHRESADQDPSAQLRRLLALGADFVMAFYAGREGASFMNAWASIGLGERLPLITTPLMTHEYWLPAMGESPIGTRTAFSWDLGAHPDELDRFRRASNVGRGDSPAVFALLGYETGRMLAAAAGGSPGIGGGQLRDALEGIAFTSPRGALALDPVTGETSTVDYLIDVRRGTDGTPSWATAGTLALPASFSVDYRNAGAQDGRPGWLNPYLVT
jgi:branched-chain amino acid transport system substrate-binding protein